MNSETQIEQMLRRARFRTPAELDERILSGALDAMQPQTVRSWAPLRRAAIVLLSIGVAAAVVAYLRAPSLTLAQVQDAMTAQTWVHVKYDNGREQWQNLTNGSLRSKDPSHGVVLMEPDGLWLRYVPPLPFVYKKAKWFEGDEPPRDQLGRSPWEVFVAPKENAAGQSQLVERHPDELDGRKLVRFDRYIIDAMDRRILVNQLWADPQTRLPVQVRQVLQLGERVEQKRDAIVGTYSFPATGPSSLEDLGVPSGLPIVDAAEKPSEEVAAILQGAKAAHARFPTCWRIVMWKHRSNGEADLVYRDGLKRAWSRWFTSHADGLPDFPASPATVEQVLNWFPTRTPIEQNIVDGQREFHRRNPLSYLAGEPKRPRVRVTEFVDWGDNINFPPGAQWIYPTQSLRRIDTPDDAPAGIVVLRQELGEQRRDHWIDPARDFVCVRRVEMRRVGDQWKLARIDALEEWNQLPGGHWVAGQMRFESYGVGTNLRDQPHVEVTEIDFRVLDPADIPPGTFDGEPLLKDADLETY